MSLQKAAECVRKNKSFLVTSHTNLEGDALGSELAFANLLRKLGKRVQVVNQDPVPAEYQFLPDSKKAGVVRDSGALGTFDCFALLDCSDLSRAGSAARFCTNGRLLLNIDHHISNSYFGKVNWVDPRASSTSEMVYRLYKKMGVPFDKKAAVLLYVGMLTDTGSFRYPNTTAFTHEAAAELLGYGLSAPLLYRHAYENIPFEHMKALARILGTLRQDPSGKVIWLQIRRSFFRGGKAWFDLGEQVLTLARAVKGAELVILFKEEPGKRGTVRVNFRSQGHIDVNGIARLFGGGGHRTASGCLIRGSISQAMKKVLSGVKGFLK